MAVHILRQAFLLALVALTPATVLAQLATTIDAGAVRVRYAGSDPSSVVSLTPAITFEHQRGVLMGTATGSRFPNGGNAVQAVLAGSWFAGNWRGFHLSLGAAAEGGSFGSGVSTGSLLGDARAHWVGERVGAWGAASHGLANDAAMTRSVSRVELGGWWQLGALTAAAWAAPARVEGGIRYTDLQSSVRWVGGPLELNAAAGIREGTNGSSWGSATAAYWLTSHFALVASGGSFAADPSQALPAGEYLSMSVRFATRPTPRRIEARRASPVTPPPVARPLVAAFEVNPAGAENQTITVLARRARTVEIMGDFSEWETISLQSIGADRWRVTVPLSSGTHRFNIRVDGREWGVPPGVTSLHDEFSGVVAVLYIP